MTSLAVSSSLVDFYIPITGIQLLYAHHQSVTCLRHLAMLIPKPNESSASQKMQSSGATMIPRSASRRVCGAGLSIQSP